MAQLEEIATAALAGESLQVRALVQEFLREHPHLVQIPQPQSHDERILAIAAGLIELFAARRQQPAPSWTGQIGAVAEPIFLVQAAQQMRRLRELCLAESPEPLRRRRLYALPEYLDYV